MHNSLMIFDEPELEFRFSQRVQDPHDGLGLFGPFDADLSTRPASLSYILIGAPEGIELYKNWAKQMLLPATFAPKANYRLWPSYPGFEAAFEAKWSPTSAGIFPLDRDALLTASRQREPHERAFGVVEKYLTEIQKLKDTDDKIGIIVCVVPDEVWQNCRPKSFVPKPIGQALSRKQLVSRKTGQMELFDQFNREQYLLSPDFRRQLKARSMSVGIPLQIIRESSLRPDDDNKFGQRSLTPLSDRMWNLGTTLYYKCGGKPWRLVTARDGVCYIGVAFRLTGEGNTACCAAQMFLNTGDGVVFLGQFGPWYSPAKKQFHLSKAAARNLLQGVLKTYADQGGKELTEIFLHSRSTINDEEFEGYKEACPPNVKLIGVRVKVDRYGIRLFRPGEMPVMRGTFWRLGDHAGLLWAAGFKPRIGSYDGWETPAPLRIDIQYGDAPIERVAQDILGLTKLNYNACHLGDAQPVTVGFSDAVGEILVSNPTVTDRKPNFKFYI